MKRAVRGDLGRRDPGLGRDVAQGNQPLPVPGRARLRILRVVPQPDRMKTMRASGRFKGQKGSGRIEQRLTA
jgi:hypothetical protein